MVEIFEVKTDRNAVENECWVKFYEDTNFNDNSLTVRGPAEYSNMRQLPNSNGYDWG